MKEIQSVQNPTLKKVVNYIEKARDRKKDGVFVVEGIRENQRALMSGYKPIWFFYDEAHFTEGKFRDMIEYRGDGAWIHQCSSSVFSKIAYRAGVANAIGVYERIEHNLDSLKLPENPLVLVLEAIEKPGNLGAMLRTANAAGVSAVLVADGVVDVFHPHVVRNSLGGFFDVPLIAETSPAIIEFLRQRNISIQVTYLEGALPHYECDLKSPTAIVMGAEDKGVTSTWIESADSLIKIPMDGVVDSLNVSVAAGIMLFEANRQRA